MPLSPSKRRNQIVRRIGQLVLTHGPLFVAPPDLQAPVKMELVPTLPAEVKEELERLAQEYSSLLS